MITAQYFYEILVKNQIDFFCGVPDSLLKSFCAFLLDYAPQDKNVITANEGAAVGLASGYYLATKKYSLVYMQNSGLGNAINPILSLVDPEVYSIPLILLIGWRGEPGVHDEPQHIKQGKITTNLLETLGIEYAVLADNHEDIQKQISLCTNILKEKNQIYAFLVKKNTFANYICKTKSIEKTFFPREEAIRSVLKRLQPTDIVVSTTGMISRELFELRNQNNESNKQDFLTVGSMGHANQIAFGISMQMKNRRVFCFDGDGAVIMHLGSLAITGSFATNNFVHILYNNGSHDSVGGQPTVGFNIDFLQIARACGYKKVFRVTDEESLDNAIKNCIDVGPFFIEFIVKKGSRADLGRPTSSPIENKNSFMAFLSESL